MLKLTYNYDVIWVWLIFMAFFKKKLVRVVLPTVLSAVVGLLGNAVFSLEHSSALFAISIIGLIVSLVFDVILISYYKSLDTSTEKKIEELENKLKQEKESKSKIQNDKDALEKLIIAFQKCFDNNAELLYKLVDNARNKKVIDLNIWNQKLISDFVCNNLFPFIKSIAEVGDSFSVSVIVPQVQQKSNRTRTTYSMLSYDGKNKQKPHLYKRSISQKDAYKYYYGKLFKRNNPEIACLMTPDEINSEFYFSDSSKKGKYEQYIGVPICCDGNKMIGLLQVVADKGSIISSNKNDLDKIINNYITCFSDFVLFADKVEKGIALDLR